MAYKDVGLLIATVVLQRVFGCSVEYPAKCARVIVAGVARVQPKNHHHIAALKKGSGYIIIPRKAILHIHPLPAGGVLCEGPLNADEPTRYAIALLLPRGVRSVPRCAVGILLRSHNQQEVSRCPGFEDGRVEDHVERYRAHGEERPKDGIKVRNVKEVSSRLHTDFEGHSLGVGAVNIGSRRGNEDLQEVGRCKHARCRQIDGEMASKVVSRRCVTVTSKTESRFTRPIFTRYRPWTVLKPIKGHQIEPRGGAL